MNLRRLQAYRAVMKTGSVTEAGAHMHLTQSAVSRLLAALEDEVGFKLFTRRKGRLEPTTEGLTFFHETERILLGIDEIQTIAEDIRTRKSVHLRIVAMPQITDGLLPEVLAAFAKQNPNAKFSLESRSRLDVERWMAGAQFDLGFAMLPIDHPLVRCEPFIEVPALAAVPLADPLSRRDEITARDLDGARLIVLSKHTLWRTLIDNVFAEADVTPDIRFVSASVFSGYRMAASNLGITLIDPFVANLLPPDRVAVLPFKPTITLQYGFLLPLGQRRSTVTEDFMKCTVETVEAMWQDIQRRLEYPSAAPAHPIAAQN